jgi:cytochrome bd-type quinol oxidase subunit 2
MKKVLPFLIVEIILSFLLALFMDGGISKEFGTIFGLINLILGIIGLIVGVVLSLMKEKNTAADLLISSALLLLMGFLTCSFFPFRLNG